MLSLLKNILPENRILINEPMKNHTSFKAGGPARILVIPETVEEIKRITESAKSVNFPYMIIGNGSNLLVKDEGIDALVIKLSSSFSDISVSGDTITANSGAALSRIASTALLNSLTGFENLSGIPGTLGGAIYMNAGAYGSEMKDVLTEVTYLNDNKEIITTTADTLSLSYRHSMFKDNNYVILSASIKLEKGNFNEIKALMDETAKKRRDKQPLEYPSAGSTFKRPEGHFAGKLIEDAGLRGFSYNGARVSEKHCGFIVSDGTATASDILTLMDMVRKKVYEKFGVMLEPEVKII